MEKISVNKSAIIDLLKLKENFNSIIESLELMSDEKFMKSLKKSDEEVKKRDFANWDEL